MHYRIFCWACYWLVISLPVWIGQRKNPVTWWALPYAGEWAYRADHRWGLQQSPTPPEED